MFLLKTTVLRFMLHLCCSFFMYQKLPAQDSTYTYDVLQYSIPAGWIKAVSNHYISYTKYTAGKKKYCRVVVCRSENSSGNASKDFSNEWRILVLRGLKTDLQPAEKVVLRCENGWLAEVQKVSVDTLQQHRSVMLLSFSNSRKVSSVIMVANDVQFKKYMEQLVASVKPVKNIKKLKPSKAPKLPLKANR